MESDLFSYTGWDPNDDRSEQYYNCVFKRDFGPFKEGETCNCILIDTSEGVMTEYDREGNELRKVKIVFAIAPTT